MTAVPLTLEDLERLIRWGERCDVVEALKATHEALRSVMADAATWAERASDRHAESIRLAGERDEARTELRSVMADAEGLRDALMVAERMIESREKEANEAREQVRVLEARLREAGL